MLHEPIFISVVPATKNLLKPRKQSRRKKKNRKQKETLKGRNKNERDQNRRRRIDAGFVIRRLEY